MKLFKQRIYNKVSSNIFEFVIKSNKIMFEIYICIYRKGISFTLFY